MAFLLLPSDTLPSCAKASRTAQAQPTMSCTTCSSSHPEAHAKGWSHGWAEHCTVKGFFAGKALPKGFYYFPRGNHGSYWGTVAKISSCRKVPPQLGTPTLRDPLQNYFLSLSQNFLSFPIVFFFLLFFLLFLFQFLIRDRKGYKGGEQMCRISRQWDRFSTKKRVILWNVLPAAHRCLQQYEQRKPTSTLWRMKSFLVAF